MPFSRRSFVRCSLAAIPLGGVSRACVERVGHTLVPHLDAAPIYLDHNENAFGPSDAVHAALTTPEAKGNRYPRKQYDALRCSLATLHSVDENHVLLSCGSS